MISKYLDNFHNLIIWRNFKIRGAPFVNRSPQIFKGVETPFQAINLRLVGVKFNFVLLYTIKLLLLGQFSFVEIAKFPEF